MVHFQRFRWTSTNLSSIEEFRHLARALSTLLRKASKSASYYSSRLFFSPWQLIRILRRGMPSHSSFDASFFLYGAMSSSSSPRTHDVRVVDTSLIFSVITLTFSQPFYGSRTVLSLPDSPRDFYRSGLYPAGSSLSIAGIVCIAAPTINASGCGRSTLHSPHRV